MYLHSKLTIQSEITRHKKKKIERNVSVIHGQFVPLSTCNQMVLPKKKEEKKKKIEISDRNDDDVIRNQAT